MSPFTIGTVICGFVFGAALLAMRLRAALPQHHLNADTKDTVKLAMGLVATMSALVLGLLVASAKGAYDSQKGTVIQMAGKIAFLDRVLAHYGPDAAESRALLHRVVEGAIAFMWPEAGAGRAKLAPGSAGGEALYDELQKLAPQTDSQRALKSQALAIGIDLGQMRWMLYEQSGSSISAPLLVIVVFWLSILFFSFGLFGPPNPTTIVALLVAALSVAGAIFLILELDRPFGGLIQISRQPMLDVLNHIGK